MIRDWSGERQARELRHWPTLVYLAERVARSEHLDALIVIGSFAKGHADEASDLDLLIAVSEGRFPEAWDRRRELETRDALVAWDFRPEPHKLIGTRKFLTRDMIKVELQLSDASAAGAVLAEPHHVLIGEDSITERYAQVEPIPPEVLSEYAQRIRDEGLVPEVESRYSELMEAIRRAR
ncbi:MAG: nucleotidyltransferase domain-containing protein [Actinobacteria bacterium]|nr:nucleotidyltransferase domain-containing protein [Actinomycetota bacterium]